MTKLEWGTKRLCQHCSAKFYDMRNNPIKCPKCGGIFETQAPGRRSRARATASDDTISKVNEEDVMIDDLDLPSDLDAEIGGDDDDTDLIEDTSDLGEDLDDMVDVIDNVDETEEQ